VRTTKAYLLEENEALKEEIEQFKMAERFLREKITSLTMELEEKTEKMLEEAKEARRHKRNVHTLMSESLDTQRKLACAEEMFCIAVDAWRFRDSGGRSKQEELKAEKEEFDSRKAP